MKLLLLLTFFSLCSSLWCTYLIKETMSSLIKASQFYEAHFEQVNLDSIFGLRAAEGVLYELIKPTASSFYSDSHLRKQVLDIFVSIESTAQKAFKHLQKSSDNYDHSFGPIIAKRWYYQTSKRKKPNLILGVRNLNAERISTAVTVEPEEVEISEGQSDYCMTNLLGTQREGLQKKCVVPDSCWTMMTRLGVQGYFLTHQALYFILADVIGCTPTISLDHHYKSEVTFYTLGSNIYHEMNALQTKGFKETDDKDLFLEQGLLCRWLGIGGCFNEDRLKLVLTWQDKCGCIKDEEIITESVPYVGRRLQVEHTLTNGCLSHATGLFTAYLATALHWLIMERSRQSSLFDFTITPEEKFKLVIGMCLFLIIIGLAFLFCRRKLRKYRFLKLIAA